MENTDIVNHRLINQKIAATKFNAPEEVVSWMIAMQAQEYAMAKWSIGLRMTEANDNLIEKAFNDGKILRTHLMRPTWHFVSPADIRWLLALTAPRIASANAFMYRKVELDHTIFKRSNDLMIKMLQGRKHYTRARIQEELKKIKINADGHRLSYIMMQAELDGIVCSGPREGKQFTYALLEERAKPVKALSREEALAKFAQRYFTSRGPATLKDFTTWSGLTVKDAKVGIYTLGKEFTRKLINGQEYIYLPQSIKPKTNFCSSFLMPDYDEYGMGYKDRSAIYNNRSFELAKRNDNPIFNRMIILKGIIEGTWQRTIKNNSVSIETIPFTTLDKTKKQLLENAVKRYRSFMEKSEAE